MLIALAVLAGVAIVFLSLVRRPTEPRVNVAIDGAQPVSKPSYPAASVSAPASTPPVQSNDTVEQLIMNATGGDAGKRAAAITALADAPRAQALPVLGRILTDGEPEIDRPLALRSLRELALNQGDADGAIRDTVRHAIYHGDDLTKKDDAQETLDIIEESRQGQ